MASIVDYASMMIYCIGEPNPATARSRTEARGRDPEGVFALILPVSRKTVQ